MWILNQDDIGEKSEYHDYIKIFPDHYDDFPVMYTKEELEVFPKSHIKDMIE